jgi:GT2 family glycosyltransferase
MADPAAKSRSKVYVLLLNWHGWKDSIECMESLLRQRYRDFQIILCDNDSHDDSMDRIRAWARGEAEVTLSRLAPGEGSLPKHSAPLGFVEHERAVAEAGGGGEDGSASLILIQNQENLGFAGGNNVGLRYAMARGDAAFVWVLNNDTVVDADALEAMVDRAAQDERIGMVGSKLLYYDEPDLIQATAGGRVIKWNGMTQLSGRNLRDGSAHEKGENPLQLDYITGASLLVRTELLDEIGGIDERYFIYSEEVDWCLRALRRGWKLAYSPESRVWHKEGKTVGYRTAFHEYFATRNALLLVRTFYPAFVPLAFVYSLYRCMLPKVVRRQRSRLRAVLFAYRDFFTGQFNIGTANVVKPRD